ncbi:MAG: GNAT family N-acetyltransferase [Candidatus Methanofastidiosia archaeon]|jgi:ribosomal protein S18 acetylase RimI-like enzyme
MDITIEELNKKNVDDVHQVDGTFSINSKLVLTVKDNKISYTVVDVPEYKKKYKKDDIDYSEYINNPDKVIYLAYINDEIAGQIILRKNWNNYAYIEDISVDKKYRRKGIGKLLILYAKKWAKTKKLAGIMLETQNNNVAGCTLYEKCGFVLGGLDVYLYEGLHPDTDEIALYWYYHLKDDHSIRSQNHINTDKNVNHESHNNC